MVWQPSVSLKFTDASFVVTHDFDVVCLLKTFLDSSIPNDYERINIKGYYYPSNRKRNTFLLLKEMIKGMFSLREL